MWIGELRVLLLCAVSMIFCMALGYWPSRCRQSLVGVNGVELTRIPLNLLGSVMCGRRRELER